MCSIHCSLRLQLSNLLLLLSFSTRKHVSVASRAILSNVSEKQCTQNQPPYLSGLLRALFPTTFLEIAVYASHVSSLRCMGNMLSGVYMRKTGNGLYRSDGLFTQCPGDFRTTLSGSLSLRCIRLHDATKLSPNLHAGASQPGASSPQSIHRSENFPPV